MQPLFTMYTQNFYYYYQYIISRLQIIFLGFFCGFYSSVYYNTLLFFQSNQHTSIRPSTSSGHSLGASSSTKQPQTQPQITTDKAFQCPMCPLLISHPLKRNHLVKHFYAQLSAEVATKSSASEAPFECHLCRHVAVDRIR